MNKTLRSIWEVPPPARDILMAIEGHGYIAGGMARWLFLRGDAGTPEDIDIFSSGWAHESIVRALTQAGYEKTEDQPVPVATRMQKFGETFDVPPIQVIHALDRGDNKTFGPIEEQLARFDFTVNQFAVEKVEGHAVFHVGPQSLQHEEQRQLVVHNIVHPLQLILRIAKYARKGYTISNEQAYKILEDWECRPAAYKDRVDRIFVRSFAGNWGDGQMDQGLAYELMFG